MTLFSIKTEKITNKTEYIKIDLTVIQNKEVHEN